MSLVPLFLREFEVFIRSRLISHNRDAHTFQNWNQLQESSMLPAILHGKTNVWKKVTSCQLVTLSGTLMWPRHPSRIYCSDFLSAGAAHTCTHNRNKSNIDCTASLSTSLHPYWADQTLGQVSQPFLACKRIWRLSESKPQSLQVTTDLTMSSTLSSIRSPRLHRCAEQKFNLLPLSHRHTSILHTENQIKASIRNSEHWLPDPFFTAEK